MEARRLGIAALVPRIFRIKDTQRVAFEPPPTVLRQLRTPAGKEADQSLAIGGAARRIAQRVQFEYHPVGDAELAQDALPERDDFDIGLRLIHAEQLDADLVEL